MRLAVICPMGRDNGRNLRKNWTRQRYAGASLCVVENGAGVGACARAGVNPDALIASGEHPGAAKNVGIDWARENGFTHWATFDDDDYYGPDYLSELVAAFEAGHEVVGKSAHYCKLSTNCVVLFAAAEGSISELRDVTTLQGPTISSAIWDGMPVFRETGDWGEDLEWCVQVARQGKRLWSTSRNHFCYMRYGHTHGHAYPMRDDQLLSYSIGDLYDVGAWGSGTPGMIDGAEPAFLTPLERPELEMGDHPATERLRAMGAPI